MVTGSHNPAEYNGFKISKNGLSLYGGGIQDIRRYAENESFATGQGNLTTLDALDSYGYCIEEKIHLDRPLKVVVDAGNGTAGLIAPAFMEHLGCDVVSLYCEPDGHFPNHLPDPTVPAYMKDLRSAVLENGADLGVGFDGDADRIGVIDEKGAIIWGDSLLGIYASDVLARHPGAPVIFEVKCSLGLIEYIERLGGKPVMWKTGHSLIKAKMRELDSPLAGEMSGHMFFGDDYYGYDDAIYASGRLLQILARDDRPLSNIAGEIPHYEVTPEIRVNCADEEKFQVVDRLRDIFSETEDIIDVDGVRVQFPDGWGLVRASNTQPVLVLRFEARTKERLREIMRTVLVRIEQFPAVDVSPMETLLEDVS
jgi:phosphomannomutase/phosphoglucomutase